MLDFPRQVDFDSLLKFSLIDVTNRYAKEASIKGPQAALVEREFKRFFFLASFQGGEMIPVLSKSVDGYWHTFLLFTRLYANFCDVEFGSFIHHEPAVDEPLPLDYATVRDFYVRYVEAFKEAPPHDVWPNVRAGKYHF